MYRTKDVPPEVADAIRAVQRACKGRRVDHVATALLYAYASILLKYSEDYDQFTRNADEAHECLCANGRVHFDRNN
jgi:hypothetical protein